MSSPVHSNFGDFSPGPVFSDGSASTSSTPHSLHLVKPRRNSYLQTGQNIPKSLLLRMRRTEGESIHQDLGFVSVERRQQYFCLRNVPGIVIATGILRLRNVLRAEIVCFPGFGGETSGRCRAFRHSEAKWNNVGLPVGAEMVLARIDEHVEVRIGMSGSDPQSIDRKSCCWTRRRIVFQIVLKEIDERFASLNLRSSRALFCGANIKFYARRTASRP